MKRQTFNSPKTSSPGFVYFNTSTTNPNDTEDFLSFNANAQSPQRNKCKQNPCGSPQQTQFSPGYASSPVQFRGNSPRTPNNYQKNRFQNRNFQKQNSYSNNYNNTNQYGKFQRQNSYSSNSSFHSSYSDNSFHDQGRKRNSDGSEKQNIERFIHPSFFEDPWANLMQDLEKEEEKSKVGEPTKETNRNEKETSEGSGNKLLFPTVGNTESNDDSSEENVGNSGSGSENSSSEESGSEDDVSQQVT